MDAYDPNIAYIKAEFILEKESCNKQARDTEPSTQTEQNKVNSEASCTENNSGKNGKRPAEDEPSQQPDGKKRGMNKKRPRMAKVPKFEKLCRFLCAVTAEELEKLSLRRPRKFVAKTSEHSDTTKLPDSDVISQDDQQTGTADAAAEFSCPDPTCQYSHDVVGYLSSKQPDLGSECVNFTTFGLCPHGITCRYAGAHLKDGFNDKKEDLWEQMRSKRVVTNLINKETHIQLRKKKYEFGYAIKKLVETRREIKHGAAQSSGSAPSVNMSQTSTGAGSAVVVDAQEKYRSVADGVAKSNGNATVDVVKESLPELSTDDVTIGPTCDEDLTKLRPDEKRKVVWRSQLYLAPLTTLGNLPFRRSCKLLGADITCGEMAVCKNLLQGDASEWALVKRHPSEDVFGVQLCASNPELMLKAAYLCEKYADIDFVDINAGCPIDFVYEGGAGSGLMRRLSAMELMVRGLTKMLSVPVTVKTRTALKPGPPLAGAVLGRVAEWGGSAVTLHGRTREQRYTKLADWDYIGTIARQVAPLPLFGNGDVMDFEDYEARMASGVAGVMIGRGALVKPWVFTEIKERRHWDISSRERLDILRGFVNHGLEHWGSDTEGVEKTRRFLLEWQSFLCRYIPVGLLERPPQGMNQKPPPFVGRDDLETLMASKKSSDWVKISEMLLGPVPDCFEFVPKHRANAWG